MSAQERNLNGRGNSNGSIEQLKLQAAIVVNLLYNGLAENCDFKVADECQTATYFSSIEEGYRFSATRCKLKEQNSSIYAGEVYSSNMQGNRIDDESLMRGLSALTNLPNKEFDSLIAKLKDGNSDGQS